MMRPSTTLLRKLITLPRLSPSHTSSRILSRLVPSQTHVTEYQPVLILQCSPDLIADPAMRKSNVHEPRMLLESLEEGVVRWDEDMIMIDGGEEEKWYDVGTVIGEIMEDDDEDEEEDDDVVEEWTWQAYLDEKDE